MTNLQDLALKPRAVAVLCALRSGLCSTCALADSIGDPATAETSELCRLLAAGVDGYKLILEHPPYPNGTGLGNLDLWGLSHDGLGWLQLQGLDATENAKQALYAATDAQAVRSC